MLWLIVFIAAIGIPLPISPVLLALGAFAGYRVFNIVMLIGMKRLRNIKRSNTSLLSVWKHTNAQHPTVRRAPCARVMCFVTTVLPP